MARSLKSFGNLPGFNFSGDLVGADEVDIYEQYTVQNPSVSTSSIGTYIGTGAATGVGTPVVLVSKRVDYPRNLQITLTGATSIGGTMQVQGQDQYGGTNVESIGIGTAANGSVVGSTIFATIGSLVWTPANSNNGTINVGYAIGTGATIGTPLFGLPSRIAGTSDVKFINYINNGTINILPSGTGAASTLAGTQFSTFKGTSALAITDSYNVLYHSTKSILGTPKQTGLGTT